MVHTYTILLVLLSPIELQDLQQLQVEFFKNFLQKKNFFFGKKKLSLPI